ncbi:MAG: hypothetical protein LBK82_03270 [Planctomycetaceae bacterium]|jgi:hypothetical protein|nr:hypothetical protein [Planctomycetaceae bacterium]
MGYDVTYHPITREEINEWYFEPLRDDTVIDRLAEKYGFLAENYRYYMQLVQKHIAKESEDASFEQAHGFMIAVAQGLMRRYDYFRDSLMTNLLVEDDRFYKYVQSFAKFVPDKYQKMRFANGIEGHWCGGVYIPPEAVKVLIYDTENDPFVKNAMLKNFDGQEELDRFLNLLHYAEENQFGILEATEVVVPFTGEYFSDAGNCELGFMERATTDPFLTTPLNIILKNIAVNEDDDFEYENVPFDQDDDVIHSPEELAEMRAKNKRQTQCLSFLCGIGCLAWFGLGCFFAHQICFEQKIRKEGIVLEASIEQRYVKNEYHFLEYKFSKDNQEYKKKTRLSKSVWNQLEGEKTVSIRVLPDSPKKNRVEISNIDLTGLFFLTSLSFLIGLFLLVVSIFTFLGYNFRKRNGVHYLLKPRQIVEDRIAELAEKEKNKNRNNE